MTNAVIDNSTLTAVERVLGRVPIGIGYDLSGDLSAFEAYLTALLFYDEPARIDDYKVEHSKERSNFFKELGAVQFLPSYYGCLLKQSRQLTSDMFLKIRGGKLADNVISDFLRDIDLVVCPAWQMQSSDFYLRIRLLSDGENGGIEKYTPLMNAIFNQLSETHRSNDRPNWQKELISSSGHEIKDDYGENCGARKISGDVKAFAAGLNWLALRSVFYAICSEHLQATAITHPIRSDFLAQFYTRKINIDRPDQREAVLSYFRSTAEGIIGSSNEVLGGMALKLRTPLISAWAAVKTGSPSEARSLILDKRFSPEGIALRARMRDIEDLHEQGDVSKSRADAAKLFRDFESAMSGFCRKFGKRSDDPYGISANLISMSGTFKVLPLIDKVASLLPHRRRSISLLRSITLDILQSPKLGRTADILRSEVRHTDNMPAYRPNVDSPRFRYARSSWKEPM